jgi:hypothetical protein
MTLFGMIRSHRSLRNAFLLANLLIRPSHELKLLIEVM